MNNIARKIYYTEPEEAPRIVYRSLEASRERARRHNTKIVVQRLAGALLILLSIVGCLLPEGGAAVIIGLIGLALILEKHIYFNI